MITDPKLRSQTVIGPKVLFRRLAFSGRTFGTVDVSMLTAPKLLWQVYAHWDKFWMGRLATPPNLQEEFAGVVRRVEQMRSQQAESERQVENLFQSLLAESFGGAS
jgi:hypothetical protein